MTVDEAKVALREFMKHDVHPTAHAELSRLTAAYVAAIVREERAKATVRQDNALAAQRAAYELRMQIAGLVNATRGFGGIGL